MSDIITAVAAIGVDLGDQDAHYACLSESGELMEEGRVAMKPAAFQRTFGSFEPTRIAIEAGRNRAGLRRCLKSWGMKLSSLILGRCN